MSHGSNVKVGGRDYEHLNLFSIQVFFAADETEEQSFSDYVSSSLKQAETSLR